MLAVPIRVAFSILFVVAVVIVITIILRVLFLFFFRFIYQSSRVAPFWFSIINYQYRKKGSKLIPFSTSTRRRYTNAEPVSTFDGFIDVSLLKIIWGWYQDLDFIVGSWLGVKGSSFQSMFTWRDRKRTGSSRTIFSPESSVALRKAQSTQRVDCAEQVNVRSLLNP